MKKFLTITLLVLLTVGLFVSCNANAVETVVDTSYKVQPDGSWKMGNRVYEPSTEPYILVLPKTLNVEKDVQLSDLEEGLIPLDGFVLNEEVNLLPGTAKITLSKDNDGILFYNYQNNEDEAQAQNIYMKTHDDYSETILLDAPEDEFSHYGSLNVATVGSVDQKSYYEYGYVKKIILKIGHLVIKSQADVDQIIVDADADATKVSIDVESDKVEEVIIPEEIKDEILKNSRIPEPIVKTPSYLCFTAVEANSSVKLIKTGTPFDISLETSIDGGKTWTSYTVDTKITLSNAGDKVYFKTKNNNANFSKGIDDYYNFVFGNMKVSCSGNIMYLLDANGITTSVPEYAFCKLFASCQKLTSVPSLPATTLGKHCYEHMFYGCTELTSIPKGLLPATKMEERCYQCMFMNCIDLTSIPLLPATKLAEGCYCSMFYGCPELTSIPEGLLPATKLADDCYNRMFANCSKLASVPAGLLPATELAEGCYEGLFEGCTKLTTAPSLPATVLATKCYCKMFEGCTVLNSVTVKFTSWNPTDATTSWLEGTSSAGTLICPSTLQSAGTMSGGSASTIPNGWTVVNSTYSVSFDMQGHGTPVSPITGIVSGATISKPVDPAVDNFIFKGWYKESTCTNAWNFNTDTVTGNITLYAKWIETKTVSDILNTISGGFPSYDISGVPDTAWASGSNVCYLFHGDLSLNGEYTLISTSTALKNGSDWTFTDNSGASFTFNTTSNVLTSITVGGLTGEYAKLNGTYATPVPTYTVSFNLNGITCTAPTAQQVVENGKVAKPEFKAPEGYALAGWYQEAACTNTWDLDTDIVTEDTTLYAKWNKKPFVFTAVEAGASVKLTKNNDPDEIALVYSTDGVNFQDYTIGTKITTTNVEDKVYFRAKTINSTFSDPKYDRLYYYFVIDEKMRCDGNIMYLLDSTGESTTVPKNAFNHLFQDCAKLTTAPSLPATTLGDECYDCMFLNCTSLTTAPELPATELTNQCYAHMFQGCTSLTTAPALHAELLAERCYFQMFNGCSILGSVNMLATDVSATNCLTEWLTDTANTGTLYVATDTMKTTLNKDTYRPSGWTVANITYSVSFDMQGLGTQVAPITDIPSGAKITKPTDPTDSTDIKHTFEGWYKTKDQTTGLLSDKWYFDTDTVRANMTLYAQWTRKLESILSTTNNGFPTMTNDSVPNNAWVNSSNPNYVMYRHSDNLEVYSIEGKKIDLYIGIKGTYTKDGDKYVIDWEGIGVGTCNMTEGKFTSFVLDCTGGLADLSGTYTAPKSSLPAGALKGVFTVSDPDETPNSGDEKKVHFSQGNLVATIDATGAPTAWKFSAHQYDYLGERGANKTIGNTAGDVDLFGWSTSTNGGTSTTDNYGIKTSTTVSDYSGDFYDWGKAVGDGNTWRTLSAGEWTYILSTRENAANLLAEDVTVCGVEHCLVIAPDACLNSYVFDKTKKSYDAADWATAEAAGLVCLPPAGYRDGTDVKSGEGNGFFYWASTTDAADRASNLGFKKSDN